MRAVILGLLTASIAFSQSFQGTLRGRAVDPNGAAASAAVVSLTDEGTSHRRQTASNEQGEYTFASLTPPNTTLTNSSFGVITSQINNPRLVQPGTRITF